ncbi:hypothetical protein EHM92_01685 [bacterium]|nr:MAG: hypothetical protein EHM92_01685 [bacterium]
MHRTGNLWWGLLLIALGVMFLFDNMNMLDFGDVIRTYWPALLVLWGVSILLSRSRVSLASSGGGTVSSPSKAGGVRDVFNDRNDNPDTEHVSYSAVFGDLSLHVMSTNFKGGTVSTVFGDTMIDLSSATLADGENMLKLSGTFGDARLMLAPSMPYAISARSLFGAIQAAGQKRDGFSSSLELQSPEYASALKKVRIEATAVFGDITFTR